MTTAGHAGYLVKLKPFWLKLEVMRMDFEIVDGIICYAPDIAREEDGYPAQGFDVTDELEQSSFWVRSRNRLLIHLFRRFVAREGTPDVLEIGCGTGNFLGELSRSGMYNVTGSEAYLAGLRYARLKRPGIKFIQMDALRIPFQEEFDAVGMFDVLEHIEDDSTVLANIHGALRPGGTVIISVPQYQFMWSELDELVHHKRRYSRSDLLEKISRAGLDVTFSTSFVCTLFPLMLAKRFLGRRSSPEHTYRQSLETHVKFSPWLNGIMDRMTTFDEFLIRRGASLPFGGTLVVVARKRP